jgi:hypothetical protein
MTKDSEPNGSKHSQIFESYNNLKYNNWKSAKTELKLVNFLSYLSVNVRLFHTTVIL